jgi:site-specific DNA recombinase
MLFLAVASSKRLDSNGRCDRCVQRQRRFAAFVGFSWEQLVMRKSVQQQETAVLYLRMSDERQEHSISEQRSELLKYAQKHGYRVLREYTDSAISGDDTARRVGFLRMREDSQKGHFQVVLSWDQDRFGRFDPIEGGYWILPFRNAGVRLETIAQGRIDWNDFAGRLLYLVQQEAKHAYLRDLSRNVLRGQLAKAREGRGADGSAPYGYRLEDGVRVIVPEEAVAVRKIFDEYLKSGTIRSVAASLNAKGIRSPRGKQWRSSTVRSLLVNKKYTGAFVWGKYAAGYYHGTENGEIVPRQKTDKKGPTTPVEHPDRFEAIVDGKTFRAVQKRLARQRRDTSPLRQPGERFLLSGLLKCGHCGYAMIGYHWNRKKAGERRKMYTCSSHHFQGKKVCTRNTISEAALVDCAVRIIREHYLSEANLDRLRKAVREECQSRAVAEESVDVDGIRRRIAELGRRIDSGAERIFAAPPSLTTTLYAKLEQLRAERDRLVAELAAAERRQEGTEQSEFKEAEEAILALGDLRGAFEKADPTDTRELLNSVVSRIDLFFDRHQHGKYTRTTFREGLIRVRPHPAFTSLSTTSRPSG